VDVVGHDDEFINIDTGVIRRDFVPNGLNHSPRRIQPHTAMDDFSE
jgi:hypothetical protein